LGDGEIRTKGSGKKQILKEYNGFIVFSSTRFVELILFLDKLLNLLL